MTLTLMKTVATFLKQTDFSIWDLCLISHSGGRSALNSILYYSKPSTPPMLVATYFGLLWENLLQTILLSSSFMWNLCLQSAYGLAPLLVWKHIVCCHHSFSILYVSIIFHLLSYPVNYWAERLCIFYHRVEAIVTTFHSFRMVCLPVKMLMWIA